MRTLLLLTLVAACSTDADPGTARPIGCPGGNVTGTLDNHPFAPVGAACARTGDSGDPNVGALYSIVLDSAYDTCPIYGGGDALAITFCGSSAPAVGAYSNDTGFDCQGGNHPVITVMFADAGQEVLADAGGTVTVTEDDGECVSGTFDIPFARTALVTDHLTGEFHALEPQ